MKISLTNCGKRFNRDWIFRNFNYQFLAGQHYAITGPNGSGKSTLLQVIGGALVTSEGSISYEGASTISIDDVFRQIAIAAPYLEVIEEMTLAEFLQFHQQFKPFLKGITAKHTISLAGLTAAENKQIRYYSSGMKQRVKLIQAIFSDVDCLLLDEPCTNLDTEGIQLYQQLIHEFANNRTIIVSSNDIQEYGFCEHVIRITDYK
ncbi:ABC transporter ATP-binding protein [Flavitalea sp.]|nr:ATP-binding cassette domain-containing protein [Flavitalea sp.]